MNDVEPAGSPRKWHKQFIQDDGEWHVVVIVNDK